MSAAEKRDSANERMREAYETGFVATPLRTDEASYRIGFLAAMRFAASEVSRVRDAEVPS